MGLIMEASMLCSHVQRDPHVHVLRVYVYVWGWCLLPRVSGPTSSRSALSMCRGFPCKCLRGDGCPYACWVRWDFGGAPLGKTLPQEQAEVSLYSLLGTKGSGVGGQGLG